MRTGKICATALVVGLGLIGDCSASSGTIAGTILAGSPFVTRLQLPVIGSPASFNLGRLPLLTKLQLPVIGSVGNLQIDTISYGIETIQAGEFPIVSRPLPGLGVLNDAIAKAASKSRF